MKNLSLYTSICLALAGCAAPVTETPIIVADAGAAAEQHCWRESQVGTNIPRTICDTVHTEADRTREINDIHDRMLRANTMMPAVGDPMFKGPH